MKVRVLRYIVFAESVDKSLKYLRGKNTNCARPLILTVIRLSAVRPTVV